ncbi:MAG: hypothetical protein KDK36_22545 [Leptospiraceae bacterium]|nr:hypothetical protein [Leptospiraceae bacterium]
MKHLIAVFLLLFSFSFCSSNNDAEDERNKLITTWFLAQNNTSIANEYSKVFYMNSSFISVKNYDLYFTQATTENVTSSTNKKFIIIHGWQSSDRNVNSIPNAQSLKTRLVETIWSDLFATDFLTGIIAKGYDVYFYTYLTSDNISSNATRFKSQLETLFGSQTNNVVIYAHSMGGLVTRGALYEFSSTPSSILRILTAGTPYHGSPWANSQFQDTSGVLGDLATFFTSSNGGKDLAYDNYDNTLSGASNSYLTTMNSKSGRDNLIYAYYGSLDSSASNYAGSDSTLTPACSSLGSTFANSDCIVPVRSAIGTNLIFGKTLSLGGYHHTDINLRNSTIRGTILTDIP